MIIGEPAHTKYYPETLPPHFSYLSAARGPAVSILHRPKHPSHVSSSSFLQPVSAFLGIRGCFSPFPLALFRVPAFVP